jgi:hypothetical protein
MTPALAAAARSIKTAAVNNCIRLICIPLPKKATFFRTCQMRKILAERSPPLFFYLLAGGGFVLILLEGRFIEDCFQRLPVEVI